MGLAALAARRDHTPIDRDDLYECWWYRGQVDYRQVGRAQIAECEDFAAIILQAPDAPPDEFRALSREVYEELLDAVEQTRNSLR